MSLKPKAVFHPHRLGALAAFGLKLVVVGENLRTLSKRESIDQIKCDCFYYWVHVCYIKKTCKPKSYQQTCASL